MKLGNNKKEPVRESFKFIYDLVRTNCQSLTKPELFHKMNENLTFKIHIRQYRIRWI